VDRPFHIQRLDSALDQIVAPNAKLESLGEHFGLTEGPVWISEKAGGYLLFSDCAANVIYKWSPPGALSVLLEKSGYTGMDILNVGQQTISGGRVAILLIGSNGLTLDPQGRLVVAAMADRNIARVEKDGKRTILADRYEGKRFSGPNDIVAKSNGSIFRRCRQQNALHHRLHAPVPPQAQGVWHAAGNRPVNRRSESAPRVSTDRSCVLR
jgi:gluconolactonase